MPVPILLPSAEADLDAIWLYIADENPPAADRCIERILERSRVLVEFPDMGQARPDLALELRMFPVGNYILFYRPIEGGVEIVRVLHEKRDIPRFFQ